MIYFVLIGVLFLVALREGMMQRYMKIEPTQSLSAQWHAVGAMIRAAMVAIIAGQTLPDWLPVTLAVVMAWPVYNAMINLYCGKRWYYVGTTAWTDRVIRRLFWFVNFDK